MCGTDLFLGVLSIFFPPIGGTQSPSPSSCPSKLPLTHPPVWIKRGICTADSLINLALCCLGYLPGLLHAWYIIASYPDASADYVAVPADAEQGGIVTYYYVQQGPGGSAPQGQYRSRGQPAYGTLSDAAPSAGQFPGQQSGSVNAFPGPNARKAKGERKTERRAEAAGASAGSSGERVEETPPSYQEAVKGDHKVQTQE